MRKKLLLLSFLLITPSASNYADEPFFTYIGPTIGGGFNKIEYTDWLIDRRSTKDVTGNYLCGGFIIDIIIKRVIGEFSIQYIYNNNSSTPDISVQHFIYTALGKYSYSLRDDLSLTSGLGLYLETPPANRGYDGGGGYIISIGTIYRMSWDWNIIIDLIGTYGHFGIGEVGTNTKLSSGIRFGLVYKIGRI
ncbi:MAG: hypothetical protein SVZ03_02870 [Spirochaetota bacterium]|nr:hypothetical protein [Spirochaetota bacterium]